MSMMLFEQWEMQGLKPLPGIDPDPRTCYECGKELTGDGLWCETCKEAQPCG